MLLVQFQSGTNIAIDYAHQQSKEIWWTWLVRCRRRRRRWRRDAVRHGARVFVVVVVVVVIFPFCLSFSIDRRDLSTQSILGDDRPFVFFHEKKKKTKKEATDEPFEKTTSGFSIRTRKEKAKGAL